MGILTTNYMGVELKNPLVLGACNLSGNLEKLKLAEEAGVAAVVYRSLFEEQIQLEDSALSNQLEEYDDMHAEMTTLFPNIEHGGPKEHLHNLKQVVNSLSVPVFASLNAVYKETLVEYASLIEETGVAGLELNFFAVPKSFETSGHDIVAKQIDFLKAVKSAVSIPVSVKLSPFYSNVLKTVKDMDAAGADAFILFNRLFEPDIDLEREKHISPWNLSSHTDYRPAIRYIGLTYDQVDATLVANNGIYEGRDMAKLILAGADAVQSVSTFYHNGLRHATSMLNELEEWMKEKGYDNLEAFRGKLSSKQTNNPYVYKRAQYIEMLLNSDSAI